MSLSISSCILTDRPQTAAVSASFAVVSAECIRSALAPTLAPPSLPFLGGFVPSTDVAQTKAHLDDLLPAVQTQSQSVFLGLCKAKTGGMMNRRGFPDYGFYSSPSDQRGPPFSFADYGSLGPQAAQLLQSEHATSACNSPLQHLASPDQYKSPGTNPGRPGAFPGASSPGPVADLYGPTSQDSGVGNYISAASPQPGSGFGHSIALLLSDLMSANARLEPALLLSFTATALPSPHLLYEELDLVYQEARGRLAGVSKCFCVQVKAMKLQALQR
ncbi:hypothetical protein DNTS_028988 [Danionella cerebrum]|uniref:Uncharacterized protein n=1 Tax=Danionella cerebrum TaxID=2873325 RepID=A0A553RH31_9TELE|nr:hypothetical protein DNTS_028988 [Danionella translucida]